MITTNRNRFLGVHVTRDVKEALRAEAKKREVSVSRLVFEVLVGFLRKKGYTVSEEKKVA